MSPTQTTKLTSNRYVSGRGKPEMPGKETYLFAKTRDYFLAIVLNSNFPGPLSNITVVMKKSKMPRGKNPS